MLALTIRKGRHYTEQLERADIHDSQTGTIASYSSIDSSRPQPLGWACKFAVPKIEVHHRLDKWWVDRVLVLLSRKTLPSMMRFLHLWVPTERSNPTRLVYDVSQH